MGIVAPEADLFDASGTKIGRHYAGPHWESTDGGKVAVTVKESTDAPQADGIPWLLLDTKSVGSQTCLPSHKYRRLHLNLTRQS